MLFQLLSFEIQEVVPVARKEIEQLGNRVASELPVQAFSNFNLRSFNFVGAVGLVGEVGHVSRVHFFELVSDHEAGASDPLEVFLLDVLLSSQVTVD